MASTTAASTASSARCSRTPSTSPTCISNSSHEESWSLEDGIVKDGSASIEQGVGVRALSGEKTGFAYSDEIVLPALEEASRAARAIAVQGGDKQVKAWESKVGHSALSARAIPVLV